LYYAPPRGLQRRRQSPLRSLPHRRRGRSAGRYGQSRSHSGTLYAQHGEDEAAREWLMAAIQRHEAAPWPSRLDGRSAPREPRRTSRPGLDLNKPGRRLPVPSSRSSAISVAAVSATDPGPAVQSLGLLAGTPAVRVRVVLSSGGRPRPWRSSCEPPVPLPPIPSPRAEPLVAIESCSEMFTDQLGADSPLQAGLHLKDHREEWLSDFDLIPRDGLAVRVSPRSHGPALCPSGRASAACERDLKRRIAQSQRSIRAAGKGLETSAIPVILLYGIYRNL